MLVYFLQLLQRGQWRERANGPAPEEEETGERLRRLRRRVGFRPLPGRQLFPMTTALRVPDPLGSREVATLVERRAISRS